jgi:hypothetical protein
MDGDDRELLRLAFQAPPGEDNPVRILLATDAASEGIDLQKHCHRLVNYDIPFNPNKLEQRIGRIDRYGQQHPPLRRKRLHSRREAKHHQPVALQPRLEPDVPAHTRGEIPPGETPLTLVGREPPHWRYILKPGAPARSQCALAFGETGPARLQVSQLKPGHPQGAGSDHCHTAGHSAR